MAVDQISAAGTPMSRHAHVTFDQLEAARVVIGGLTWCPDGDMEGMYVDRRRLRREIRRAWSRCRFMSDGSSFAWAWLAKAQPPP
jgi:hypothetical protein